MYKMIVCDLDETLLNDEGQLTSGNVQAIQAAVAKGVYFVPNSGRSYTSFQDDLDTLGLKGKKHTYSISFNGGLIVENAGNRLLKKHTMDFEVARQVFDLAMASGGSVHVYTANGGYLCHPLKWDTDFLTQRGVHFEILKRPNFEVFKDQLLMKIIVAFPKMVDRKALKTKVLAEVKTPVTVTFSSDRYVEFNPAQVDKGRATLELAQRLNIRQDEIIAVGDNSNDLAMIQAAGLGVCMKNGLPSIQEQAQYVTQQDNNHDALQEIIDRFIL